MTTGPSRMWACWALLAMLSYATNNFLLGAVGKEAERAGGNIGDANITAIVVVWFMAGLCGCAGCAGLYYKETPPQLGGAQNIGVVILIGFLIAGATLALTLALASDPDSAGPITAMLPLNSLVVCALAWTLLGEKLGTQHVVGVCIAIAGPICMALADTSGGALRALALGCATAVVFGTSNLLRKWLAMRRRVDNNSMLVGILCTVGVISILATLVLCIAGRGLRGMDPPRLWLFAALSGVLWAAGTLFFQFGLMGLAGPCSAIANTNSVGVLLLDLIFFEPSVKALKVVGMALCVAGCVTLSLAPPPARARDVPLTASGAEAVSDSQVSAVAPAEPKV
mmetsp:Transcript_60718/g.136801  ORF Transcript_60718/g.136801 Transcript_60718/m.136801 type:complete len:340 (+) Transcript_60718:94-1113(+)